jgi:calcineurin-like phosphoesterase family protein
MIYFSSDHHFNHFNVITYCSRPFSTIDEMNESLIQKWNDTVGPKDVVWYLGDFSLSRKALPIVSRLNGEIHLIPGNHDKCFPMRTKHLKMAEVYKASGFAEVYFTPQHLPELDAMMWHLPYLPGDITEGDFRYPEWRLEDEGARLLCGHVHEKWKVQDRMINVGVDQWDFRPVSIDQISAIWE